MARPRFTPTDEQRSIVKMLAALGIRQDYIVEMIGWRSETTLRTHFQSELAQGAAEANRQVAQSLFRQATSGKCPAASMFWLKCRAGWRERKEYDQAAPALPPFVVGVVKDGR
jgi:hypothetical protein